MVLRACGASSLRVGAKVQTLWSGYGEIVRLHLDGCERPSVIIKHVRFPAEAEDPGGRSTNRSHLRKVRSYQVETHWYRNYSTTQDCRIPACLAACSHGDETLMVLEDLDAAGYPQRRFVTGSLYKEPKPLPFPRLSCLFGASHLKAGSWSQRGPVGQSNRDLFWNAFIDPSRDGGCTLGVRVRPTFSEPQS